MDRDTVVTEHYLANFDNLVRFFTFKRQGNRQEAEDIIQEAYYRALKYFHTFDPMAWMFSTWINKIIYNCEKDFNKANLKHGMNDEFDEEFYEPIVEDHAEVQDVHSIRRMIYRQPKEQRSLLLLYYVYQYSLGEISSMYPLVGYKRLDNTVKEFRLKAMREKKL